MTNYNDSNSSHAAWDKITQTHYLFKKIIAPLKEHLGINFGYMIVFNDGRYYKIIEDLECLKKWVTNVETSHIFCARNVTTYFDEPYNFTIWPEEPTCPAMEIYKEYGMWNGVTVSKVNKDYTELYWFTKKNAENGWHKWFIRNKQLLLEPIKRFENVYKERCIINNFRTEDKIFKFTTPFSLSFLYSEYSCKEKEEMQKFLSAYNINYSILNSSNHLKKTGLSPKEMEVLCKISSGYTAKAIAEKFNISPRTVRMHIENIKHKTGLHSRMELVMLYQNNS